MKQPLAISATIIGIIGLGAVAVYAGNQALGQDEPQLVSVTSIAPTIAGAAASTVPGSTPATTTAPASQFFTYNVGESGTVVVEQINDQLVVAEVTAAAGWEVIKRDRGGDNDVDVDFISGTDVVEFDAELINGEIITRVEKDIADADDLAIASDTGRNNAGSGNNSHTGNNNTNSNSDTNSNNNTTTTTSVASAASGTNSPDRGGNTSNGDGSNRGNSNNNNATTSTTNASRSNTTTSVVQNKPAGPSSTSTFTAGEAGSVTVQVYGNQLYISGVAPAAGWEVIDRELDRDDEVDVEFRSGNTEVDFSAELINGKIQTNIHTDTADQDRDDD